MTFFLSFSYFLFRYSTFHRTLASFFFPYKSPRIFRVHGAFLAPINRRYDFWRARRRLSERFTRPRAECVRGTPTSKLLEATSRKIVRRVACIDTNKTHGRPSMIARKTRPFARPHETTTRSKLIIARHFIGESSDVTR